MGEDVEELFNFTILIFIIVRSDVCILVDLDHNKALCSAAANLWRQIKQNSH